MSYIVPQAPKTILTVGLRGPMGPEGPPGENAPDAVQSLTTGIQGAQVITNMISISQFDYDAILVKDATTYYIITS